MSIPLRTTPLDALHHELGARMVPFAGHALPLQYPTGILAEHHHTRSHAALFDVSHMGQIRIQGSGAARALERLLPADVLGLAPGRQRYGFFTNDAGGIEDDLMFCNTGEALLLVVNAAQKKADLARLRAGLPAGVGVQLLDDRALLALQGPEAAAVLAGWAPRVTALPFLGSAECTLAGVPVRLARSGYTGEDGFEISVAAARAETLARALLADPRVLPAGLGARDSLRLEAGLCLYGHELDAATTPVEAGLDWAIPRVRRAGGERAGGFPGAARIYAQMQGGPPRRRVGLRPEGRAPVREGAPLTDAAGRPVGAITSGGHGPSVDAPVAMGYVVADCARPGTILHTDLRGRILAATVAPLPFVPHRYHRTQGKTP